MTTRVDVNIDVSGLLNKLLQLRLANREAFVVREAQAKAAERGVKERRAQRIREGRDPETGDPLPSRGGQGRFGSDVQRIDEEPAANRRPPIGFPHVFWNSAFISDSSAPGGGKQRFTIATQSGLLQQVDFDYLIKPNSFYSQGPVPELPEGKKDFMSLEPGPRTSRSSYQVLTDGDGTWSGARPNNVGPGNEPGNTCRSYWNFAGMTDGDAAGPLELPIPWTSCSPGFSSLGLRNESFGATRTTVNRPIFFALPVSKDTLVFVCGLAQAADEGAITAFFSQTDGWYGPTQISSELSFGIVRNRNSYLIDKIPPESHLQLRAFVVKERSIQETNVGQELINIFESILQQYTSTTQAIDIGAVIEIDWRQDIQNSGITPFPQFVNPSTGQSIGQRSEVVIGQRQAFAGAPSFDLIPFFQSNLFQYGLANLTGRSKQGAFFGGQSASPAPVLESPRCLFTTPAVYTYLELYAASEPVTVDTIQANGQPAPLTLSAAKQFLLDNDVGVPRDFYSLLTQDNEKLVFAKWTGELPVGTGFATPGQSFEVWSEGWEKSPEDESFKQLPKRVAEVKKPQISGIFLNFTGCWDWSKSSYCRRKLAALGFILGPVVPPEE